MIDFLLVELLEAGIEGGNRDKRRGHGTDENGRTEVCCTSQFMPRNATGLEWSVECLLFWGKRNQDGCCRCRTAVQCWSLIPSYFARLFGREDGYDQLIDDVLR
jgi:hypothetical protein